MGSLWFSITLFTYKNDVFSSIEYISSILSIFNKNLSRLKATTNFKRLKSTDSSFNHNFTNLG